MNYNQRVIANLRQQLLQCQEDMRVYRTLYRNERDDRRQQQHHCQELEDTLVNYLDENESLRDQVHLLHQYISLFEVPKPKKRWDSLKSGNSIAKRKSEYRHCLNQAMMHLHEVQRARIQLRIGKNEIVFIWCQNELRKLRNNLRSSHNTHQEINDDSDNDEMSVHGDAFMPDGEWNEMHLRKIIHVMDIFKISFQAYHELCLTSNSILPPLYKIRRARFKMSDVIKSLHHHTVNNFNIT